MLRKNIKKILALLLTFGLLLGMLGSGIVMADDSSEDEITLDGNNNATATIGDVKSNGAAGVDINTLYNSETGYSNNVEVNDVELTNHDSINNTKIDSLTANIESIDVKNNTDLGTAGLYINNDYTISFYWASKMRLKNTWTR